MATKILDLYDTNMNKSAAEGGPEASKVDASKSKDKTPYSVGLGLNDKGDIDEGGVGKLEGLSTYSPGNRYGYQDAVFGGGSKYAPGFTDTKTYSDSKPS